MSEPLVLNGVRYCKACVHKLGSKLSAVDQPGIFNWHSGVRHLNESGSDKASNTTLCGLDTRNQNWEEPWRVMERQREREHRRWHRERLKQDAVIERLRGR